MDNTNEIVTLPSFNGKERHLQGRHDITAEAFLTRLTAHTTGGRDDERIARTAGQFRDVAEKWWEGLKGDSSNLYAVDKTRLLNEWAYFCGIFKKRFFSVVDTTHTVEDITDVKQDHGESVHHYAERLMNDAAALHRVVLDEIKGQITDDAVRDMMNAAGQAILNGLTDAQRTTMHANIATAIRNYLNRLSNRQAFMALCRALGRNAIEPWARTQAKKTIQSPTSTFEDLHKELACQQRANGRHKGKHGVSAAKEQEKAAHAGSPGDDSEVSAVRGGFRGRGRGRGGRGRGKPRGGFANGAPTQGQQSTTSGGAQGKWCLFCKKDTHNTDQCRTLQHYQKIHSAGNPPNGDYSGKKGGSGGRASAVHEGNNGDNEGDEDYEEDEQASWQQHPVGSLSVGRSYKPGRYPPAGNA